MCRMSVCSGCQCVQDVGMFRMSVCSGCWGVEDVVAFKMSVCSFRMLQRCTTVEEMQQLSEDGQCVLRMSVFVQDVGVFVQDAAEMHRCGGDAAVVR